MPSDCLQEQYPEQTSTATSVPSPPLNSSILVYSLHFSNLKELDLTIMCNDNACTALLQELQS